MQITPEHPGTLLSPGDLVIPTWAPNSCFFLKCLAFMLPCLFAGSEARKPLPSRHSFIRQLLLPAFCFLTTSLRGIGPAVTSLNSHRQHFFCFEILALLVKGRVRLPSVFRCVPCILVNFVRLDANFVKRGVVLRVSGSFSTVRNCSCTHTKQQAS